MKKSFEVIFNMFKGEKENWEYEKHLIQDVCKFTSQQSTQFVSKYSKIW